MDVAHFEAGAFTGQTARPQSRYSPLVGNLRQRIVLIHELRKLARTKEFLDGSGHRLGIDDFLRHQVFGVGKRQTLLDRALDTNQAQPELVFNHLTDRTDTTVAQMIDIIDRAVAVTDLDEFTKDIDDVLPGEHPTTGNLGTTQSTVEFHATHGRKIVTVGREEQVFE